MCEILPINKLSNIPSAHILYIFNEEEKYLTNSVRFILDGLAKNEVILIVEKIEWYERVKQELKAKGLSSAHFQNLIFADSTHTYMIGHQFSLDKTTELINLLQPFVNEGY